ncbi:hypothetical protein LQL77_32630, partial [Rhodococcus cerastii]|nr:hypothetical protein [Rhodococcus cerastii]
SAIAALGGGVAAAGQVMPEWYTDNTITTTNCQAPVLVDDNHVQLHCHSTPGSRVTATNHFVNFTHYTFATRLKLDVSVPANGRIVSAFLYGDRDTAQLLPEDSDTVWPGATSHSFRFRPHVAMLGDWGEGHLVSVHTLFGETDVVLTIRPANI